MLGAYTTSSSWGCIAPDAGESVIDDEHEHDGDYGDGGDGGDDELIDNTPPPPPTKKGAVMAAKLDALVASDPPPSPPRSPQRAEYAPPPPAEEEEEEEPPPASAQPNKGELQAIFEEHIVQGGHDDHEGAHVLPIDEARNGGGGSEGRAPGGPSRGGGGRSEPATAECVVRASNRFVTPTSGPRARTHTHVTRGHGVTTEAKRATDRRRRLPASREGPAVHCWPRPASLPPSAPPARAALFWFCARCSCILPPACLPACLREGDPRPPVAMTCHIRRSPLHN